MLDIFFYSKHIYWTWKFHLEKTFSFKMLYLYYYEMNLMASSTLLPKIQILEETRLTIKPFSKYRLELKSLVLHLCLISDRMHIPQKLFLYSKTQIEPEMFGYVPRKHYYFRHHISVLRTELFFWSTKLESENSRGRITVGRCKRVQVSIDV